MDRSDEFIAIEEFLATYAEALKGTQWEIRDNSIRDINGHCPICFVAKYIGNVDGVAKENWWDTKGIVNYTVGATLALIADSSQDKLKDIQNICLSESRPDDAKYFEKCVELRNKFIEQLKPTTNTRFGVN